MRIEPLGEFAFILREVSVSAPELSARLQNLPGVVEAYAAFDTVGVIVDESFVPDSLWYEPGTAVQVSPPRSHEIPVLYDGEDLAEIAGQANLSIEEVIKLHAREYECRAVGFCPGFAYLSSLPRELNVPRRNSPRSRVAPGSVALAAGMTAVYPLERPGGWWLVGRTPLTLVDELANYFPIAAGDRVTFVPIDESEYDSRVGERL